MWSIPFWRGTAERAVKTFAQSLLAVGLVGATGLLDVSWTPALSAAGLATVLSVLSSLASTRVGDSSSPSLVTERASRPIR